jgi:antitoxin (DNA-binding transcriptional repressor) of toxin-antitoxin stability system
MAVTVNIHEAQTHLSRLVNQQARGHEFVIAKAGRLMVRVVPIEARPALRTLGYLAGRGNVEADVKAAFAQNIDAVFNSGR